MSKKAMKLALEALENSIDLVSNEAREAEELYGKYPTRLARIQGLVALEVAHEKAITALREALAEQPAQPYKGIADHTYQATNGRVRIDPITGDVGIGTPSEQPAQQEPVACANGCRGFVKHSPPAQRTWVGLTRKEWMELGCRSAEEVRVAMTIEAKLKEKNT